MNRRITPTQARTVGRVLRAEITRLRERDEAPAVSTGASLVTASGANQKAVAHA